MPLLSKEDWQKLDTLLKMVGFDGYFNLRDGLVEVLSYINPELAARAAQEKDLTVLMDLLLSAGRLKSYKPVESEG
jgi:hypothetical protein